jgi:hypothetical protein
VPADTPDLNRSMSALPEVVIRESVLCVHMMSRSTQFPESRLFVFKPHSGI